MGKAEETFLTGKALSPGGLKVLIAYLIGGLLNIGLPTLHK